MCGGWTEAHLCDGGAHGGDDDDVVVVLRENTGLGGHDERFWFSRVRKGAQGDEKRVGRGRGGREVLSREPLG